MTIQCLIFWRVLYTRFKLCKKLRQLTGGGLCDVGLQHGRGVGRLISLHNGWCPRLYSCVRNPVERTEMCHASGQPIGRQHANHTVYIGQLQICRAKAHSLLVAGDVDLLDLLLRGGLLLLLLQLLLHGSHVHTHRGQSGRRQLPKRQQTSKKAIGHNVVRGPNISSFSPDTYVLKG